MQEELRKERAALRGVQRLEDLAGKKTNIFSRLLTDAALAQDMETLAKRHGERKRTLGLLLGEKSSRTQREGCQKGEEEA